jgi:hypothetical protein
LLPCLPATRNQFASSTNCTEIHRIMNK